MDKFKEELKTKLGLAAGGLSMCWSETPTGEFESEKAVKIVKELESFVFEYLDSLPELN